MQNNSESTAEGAASSTSPPHPPAPTPARRPPEAKPHRLEIEGYPVEGVSIGSKETCVIFPTLDIAFGIGIGRCPRRAVRQEFLFVSDGHLHHIGALHMYVAARGFLALRPPTVFVPARIRDLVERLFEVYRAIAGCDLELNLVPLEVGEEYQLRTGLKVRAFRTYHVVPSQGYVIYSVKKKLKQEFVGLPGTEIKQLRLSGVKITNTVLTPEIAFTGDTTSDFILDLDNADVLGAKILVVESTFLDESISIERARELGHTHLSEIASHSDKLGNKAILLSHFSARYTTEEIDAAINRLTPSFRSRVYALKEGFRAGLFLRGPSYCSKGPVCLSGNILEARCEKSDRGITQGGPRKTNPLGGGGMAKNGESAAAASAAAPPPPASAPPSRPKAKNRLEIEGYPMEGLSIGGQETCVIFPTLSLAFDIGRCPQRAVSQEFLFVSHGHLDHIGGLPMYVATRGFFRLRPPTIFVPACLRDLVERLFEVHRAIDQSELKHNLVPLEVGEECEFRRDLKVKAFRTYHAIPSQGYVIYSVKQKLKQEFIGLPGSEIKRLKLSDHKYSIHT